ncbi:hypothetical protein [Streptomyces sp. NPDC047097]|uniref:hypothetical protein n=1 Tax=Streptomyces sp. NPDC047097 TaxID=3155260 RepID=UPI0033FCA5F6
MSGNATVHEPLDPVGHNFWSLEDREKAEDVGTAFINAVRRLGITFDGISISDPCTRCDTKDYVFDLGPQRVEDVAQMANAVNTFADEAERLRQEVERLRKKRRKKNSL